jgi:hypothetical protein
VFLLGLGVVERLWSFMEAGGAAGSPALLAALFGITALTMGLALMLAKPLRWPLLHFAVRSYVRENLLQELSQPNTVLVGIGPGGAIAVGLVAKVLRELGIDPPPIVVFDMAYTQKGADPEIGVHWPVLPQLGSSNCWIIQGNVNSGRSLQKLQRQFQLQNAHIFAFVISDAAKLRENIKHFMAVGTRDILPWPTERPR